MFSYSWWILSAFLFFKSDAAKLLPLRVIKPYILNGGQASQGQFPWQISLSFSTSSGAWYCSGVLVKEDWVLTAGHCGSFDLINALAYAGSVDYRNRSAESMGFDFHLPGGYDDRTLANDIGLLRLEEPLELSDNVKPIDLASETLGSNVTITVSGWGAGGDDGAGPAQTLTYITLSTIDNSECSKTYGADIIRDEMFCAVSTGNVTQATCFGDNGGPAIIYTDGNPILVGIVSLVSNRGCESGDPSVFTRIADFRDWIVSTAGL